MPSLFDADYTAAIERVAKQYNVSPEAIRQVVRVESGGNPRASTGSYNGLTQIGRTTFKEAGGKLGGMTYDEFLKASPSKQIDAYGDYLRHYDFAGQMAKHGIDVSKLPANQQFAVLQGMQFSPNGQDWKAAFSRGDFSVPVTATKQASALGNTSIGAMAGSRFGQAAIGSDASGNPLMVASAPANPPLGPPLNIQPQKPLQPQPLNTADDGRLRTAKTMSGLLSAITALDQSQAHPMQLQQPLTNFTLARSLGFPTLF